VIVQEFGEVMANRCCGRCIGRTQINQQYTDTLGSTMKQAALVTHR